MAAGTYSYDVTAVLAGGVEVPGVVASVTVANTRLTNTITVELVGVLGATSYNVYGRDGSGLRLLKNVTSGTSYVDTGPTTLTGQPADDSPSATIGVASTVGFNSGANTIAFGAVRRRHLHRDDVDELHRLHAAARRGSIRRTCPSTARRARARRARRCRSRWRVDATPADAKQRFVLNDDIVLRNSRPS